jgi:signal transduction histidine kinase
MNAQKNEFTRELIISGQQITPGKSMVKVSEQVSYRHFDAAALISEIAETTRIQLGNKPVTVDVTVPVLPVMAASDPIKVRHIITTLVSNAANLTEQGTIGISLSVYGRRLEIGVSDTGIGIKEEHMHKLIAACGLIEEDRTEKPEGIATGLTVSRKLRELVGGTISVTNNHGKGITFLISLPNDNQEMLRSLYRAE